jgi:hypothetical protein
LTPDGDGTYTVTDAAGKVVSTGGAGEAALKRAIDNWRRCGHTVP